MAKMSGGEALVKSLVREGVEVVFGLPGVQMYGIIAAIRDEPGIRLITTRHEQATTYMADGYARASGKPGVALVVPGEGLYNAGSGLATAYARSSPVLVIAGQIPRSQIGKDLGGLHEVADQMEVIRPVTKWRRQVLSPAETPACVSEAFRQMRNGRPRPVEIEMPPEAMVEREEVELEEPGPVVRGRPSRDLLEKAARTIAEARSPVIYAGGGVARSDAEAALVSLAEATNIPVIVSAGGKGSIPDGHPLCYGSSLGPRGALYEVMEVADVIIGIGTRFSLRNPAGNSATLVHINADDTEFGKTHSNTLALHGDAKATMEALVPHLLAAGVGERPSPAKAVAAARRRVEDVSSIERNEPQHTVLEALQTGIPEDAFVVWGMTQLGYYSRVHYRVYEPKTYIDSGYAGNLGYSFPTALGAKVAQPGRPVVCVVGDGGFMYNSSELSTAVKYGINTVTVVFNDGAYGNVARDLDEDFGGAYEADFVNPDFVKFAQAFGAIGMRASDPLELAELIPAALEKGGPVIIDVPVERMPRPRVWAARAPWTKPQEGLIGQPG